MGDLVDAFSETGAHLVLTVLRMGIGMYIWSRTLFGNCNWQFCKLHLEGTWLHMVCTCNEG